MDDHENDKRGFQLEQITNTIDNRRHPIEHLVLRMDWSEDDLRAANDIFEKYDRSMDSGEEIDWHKFEFDLEDRFGVSYQGVKPIILAFFRNSQWPDVCRGYASKHEVGEFREILHPEEFSSAE